MDFRYDPDDPRDLWENITPVTPEDFTATAIPTWNEGIDRLLGKLQGLLTEGSISINDARVIQHLISTRQQMHKLAEGARDGAEPGDWGSGRAYLAADILEILDGTQTAQPIDEITHGPGPAVQGPL